MTTPPRTLDELARMFADRGLTSVFEQLKPHAKQSIVIDQEPAPSSDLPLGSSHLGGLPDLPRGQEWVRNTQTGDPMTFVGQINLAEVAAATESRLLASGILFFFYDLEAFGWGFDPEDHHGARVLFHDGPVEELQHIAAPSELEVFAPARLTFTSTMDLPDIQSSLVDVELDEDDLDSLLDLIEDHELYADSRLLGHSDNIQGGMELMCELASTGTYAGTAAVLQNAGAEARAGARDWNLLLQVGGNDDTGMEWGPNDGMLYYWIKTEDLEAGRFDRSWLIFQT